MQKSMDIVKIGIVMSEAEIYKDLKEREYTFKLIFRGVLFFACLVVIKVIF